MKGLWESWTLSCNHTSDGTCPGHSHSAAGLLAWWCPRHLSSGVSSAHPVSMQGRAQAILPFWSDLEALHSTSFPPPPLQGHLRGQSHHRHPGVLGTGLGQTCVSGIERSGWWRDARVLRAPAKRRPSSDTCRQVVPEHQCRRAPYWPRMHK